MATAELEYTSTSGQTDQQLIADRYRAGHRIGAGRLGEIYTASDEGYGDLGVDNQVALQIIPEEILRNNALFNRLSVGYSALQKAAHPNIVSFRRFGRHGRIGYLSMELLEGVSLRFILDDAGTLPPDEARAVLRGVADALGFLHAHGMVHGNLRPKNVFVTDTLEVRLLDVLPLGADQSIIRGGGTSSPFKSCSARDDVFGLACMAYEMLAGKHPFNHSPPAEAKRDGREPERIGSLSEREWQALRQALSFDDAWRTASIADFTRDFGITGADRLRPSVSQPVARNNAADASPTPAVGRLSVPAPAPGLAPPVSTAAPVVSAVDRPVHAMPPGRRTGHRRALLLTLLLTSLLAWIYHGDPGAEVTRAAAYVDTTVVPALLAFRDPPIGSPAANLRPSGPSAVVDTTPVEVPPATAPMANTDSAPADIGIADSDEPGIAAVRERPESIAPSLALRQEAPSDVRDELVGQAESAVETGNDLQPARDVDEVAAIPSVVSVSEGDSVARVRVPATGYSESVLVWWTSEHTASANEDFVGANQRVVVAAPNEEAVLLIPLVDDSLPEAPESFFVSTGFRDGSEGHIERMTTVRVDIVDDD